MRDEARDLAEGKWRDILRKLGVDGKYLSGRHGPCPICGGRDRFRFDDKEGRGTWICSQCGAGDGFALLDMARGLDFRAVADRIREIAGQCRVETSKPKYTDAELAEKRRALWMVTVPTVPGDVVDAYLRSRGVGLDKYPSAIRTKPGDRPAMVAVVTGPDGNPATLHQTFLKPDGSGKADIEVPRLLLPGEIPKGSAVRLFPQGPEMGAGEGIETCLGAAKRFGVPVWATLNSSMLKHWYPPEGVVKSYVFGDADPLFGGQAAAYESAHRQAVKGAPNGLEVEPRIPDEIGTDWNDQYQGVSTG